MIKKENALAKGHSHSTSTISERIRLLKDASYVSGNDIDNYKVERVIFRVSKSQKIRLLETALERGLELSDLIRLMIGLDEPAGPEAGDING